MPRDLFVAVEGGAVDDSVATKSLRPKESPTNGGAGGRTMAKAKTMSSRQFTRTVSPKPSRTGGGAPGMEMEPLISQLGGADVDRAREAASSIRLALKNAPADTRVRLQAAGGIDALVAALRSPDPELVEHAIAAVLTLSLSDGVEPLITRNRGLEAVVEVLQTGSAAARETAAAAVFTLSSNSSDGKERVRCAGGVPALVALLRSGTLRGKKDASLALFNLTLDERCAREIVAEGAPAALLHLLATETERGLEDKVVAVLANLAKYEEGRAALSHEEGGVETLLDVAAGGSMRSKEDAVVALFLLATHVPEAARSIAEQGASQALSKLAQSGTPRAKSKAKSLLELLRTNPALSAVSSS